MGLFGTNEQPQMPVGESSKAEQQQIMPFYSQPGTHELGKIMLDPSDTILKVRWILLGYIQVGRDWKKVGEALVNEEGAAQLIAILDSTVGKEVFLTKIDDADVIRIIKDLWRTIDKLLVKNVDNWQIKKDKGTWSQIRSIIINQAYFALRRGEDATEKDFFANTTKSSYVTAQNNQQQFRKTGLQGFFG